MFRFQVTTIGKLFIHDSVTKQYESVLVKGQWYPMAGRVSHWPCVTRVKWFIHMQAAWPNKGDEHRPTLCKGLGWLYLTFAFRPFQTLTKICSIVKFFVIIYTSMHSYIDLFGKLCRYANTDMDALMHTRAHVNIFGIIVRWLKWECDYRLIFFQIVLLPCISLIILQM